MVSFSTGSHLRHSFFLGADRVGVTRKLFDEILHPDVSTWKCALRSCYRESRYRECLSLFRGLLLVEKPGPSATSMIIRACAELRALHFGKVIHGFGLKTDAIGGNLFVASSLVKLYSKCGKMDDALCVFEEFSQPDTVLWTSVISGFVQNHQHKQSLEFFARMMSEEKDVDPITLVSLVSACAKMLDLRTGRSIHGYMIRESFENSLPLLNSLLNLYGKMGYRNASINLFNRMNERDVISWGCIIACHAHHGFAGDALKFFDEMVASGVEPNAISFVSVLQACEATFDINKGKQLHQLAVYKGFHQNILVSTAVVEMYMSCFHPKEAIEVFRSMPEKDAFCFSSMLSGCVRNGMPQKSIEFFRDMVDSNFRPDAFDLVSTLTACSELGFLRNTRCYHGFSVRCGFTNHSFTSASLIESYAKCGSLDGAINTFMNMQVRDIVAWSAMLSAYGFYGKGNDALKLFSEMIKDSAVRPNEVSFLSLLSACSQSRLVQEGAEIFIQMLREYTLSPNSKHLATVIDLLGRIGELDKALEFIGHLPEPIDADVWKAFLGACWVQNNLEFGEIAAKRLMQLEPCNADHYILLSNMYAYNEKWVDAAEVRKLLKEKHLKTGRGQSILN